MKTIFVILLVILLASEVSSHSQHHFLSHNTDSSNAQIQQYYGDCSGKEKQNNLTNCSTKCFLENSSAKMSSSCVVKQFSCVPCSTKGATKQPDENTQPVGNNNKNGKNSSNSQQNNSSQNNSGPLEHPNEKGNYPPIESNGAGDPAQQKKNDEVENGTYPTIDDSQTQNANNNNNSGSGSSNSQNKKGGLQGFLSTPLGLLLFGLLAALLGGYLFCQLSKICIKPAASYNTTTTTAAQLKKSVEEQDDNSKHSTALQSQNSRTNSYQNYQIPQQSSYQFQPQQLNMSPSQSFIPIQQYQQPAQQQIQYIPQYTAAVPQQILQPSLSQQSLDEPKISAPLVQQQQSIIQQQPVQPAPIINQPPISQPPLPQTVMSPTKINLNPKPAPIVTTTTNNNNNFKTSLPTSPYTVNNNNYATTTQANVSYKVIDPPTTTTTTNTNNMNIKSSGYTPQRRVISEKIYESDDYSYTNNKYTSYENTQKVKTDVNYPLELKYLDKKYDYTDTNKQGGGYSISSVYADNKNDV